MKTLIIGANGVIGRALFPKLPGSIGLTSKRVPGLTTVNYDIASLEPFLATPDAVIYCIGVSKFAECEQFPEKSFFLNAELPQQVAQRLSPRQTFIYLSSPLAFYDFKGAKPYHYALHKRRAEEMILGCGHAKTLIIRPSKIIESAGIISEWKERLLHGETISAFCDQYISPINTAILSEQILRLINGQHTGCYNFSARDRMSYLETAQALASHLKVDADRLESKIAKNTHLFFFDQDRLDCSTAKKAVGYIPPVSRDIVLDYFQKLP